MGTPKGPHEVARVSVADPPADLLHGEVRSDQEATRLGHAALRNPLQDGLPRLAPDDGGEVSGRKANFRRALVREAAGQWILPG